MVFASLELPHGVPQGPALDPCYFVSTGQNQIIQIHKFSYPLYVQDMPLYPTATKA